MTMTYQDAQATKLQWFDYLEGQADRQQAENELILKKLKTLDDRTDSTRPKDVYTYLNEVVVPKLDRLLEQQE